TRACPALAGPARSAGRLRQGYSASALARAMRSRAKVETRTRRPTSKTSEVRLTVVMPLAVRRIERVGQGRHRLRRDPGDPPADEQHLVRSRRERRQLRIARVVVRVEMCDVEMALQPPDRFHERRIVGAVELDGELIDPIEDLV